MQWRDFNEVEMFYLQEWSHRIVQPSGPRNLFRSWSKRIYNAMCIYSLNGQGILLWINFPAFSSNNSLWIKDYIFLKKNSSQNHWRKMNTHWVCSFPSPLQTCMTTYDYHLNGKGKTDTTVTKGCVPTSQCQADMANNINNCMNKILNPSCTSCCDTPLCNEPTNYKRLSELSTHSCSFM